MGLGDGKAAKGKKPRLDGLGWGRGPAGGGGGAFYGVGLVAGWRIWGREAPAPVH